MRALAAVIALIPLSVSITVSQEPSTSVYPSEDELLEALRLGEIDFRQYLILQEVIVHGIDSADYHLLDEIPNLSFFLTNQKSMATSLEKEQAASFSKPADKTGRTEGTFGYQYYQELEQEGQARYRNSVLLHFRNHFEVAFKLHREFSGRERFVSRWLAYKNTTGRLKEVRLGSFSQRLGLGTIFGYRGKLLEFSDELDEESFLFPDYGGYNGVYSRLGFNRVEIEALSSVNRDANHALISAGGMVSLAKSPLRPGVIVGVSYLKNRNTGKRFHDINYGFSSRYRYYDSYLSFELCAQGGERSSWGGFVAEGRHHFGLAEIKYAGWVYDDNYLDLTGGSKAGNLHHTDTLDKVDLVYSDKRSGQEGGMLKSIVLLNKELEMVNSLMYAGRNRDTANFQFLSGLVKKLNQRIEIRLDYLNKTKKRVQDKIDRRTRIETRIRTGNMSARSYITHNTKSGRSDHVSLFLNFRYRSAKVGSVEIWSNLARFDLKDAVIDYWYAYVKSEQQVFSSLTAAVKMSHRYDRSSEQKHYTVVSLEVNTGL